MAAMPSEFHPLPRLQSIWRDQTGADISIGLERGAFGSRMLRHLRAYGSGGTHFRTGDADEGIESSRAAPEE